MNDELEDDVVSGIPAKTWSWGAYAPTDGFKFFQDQLHRGVQLNQRLREGLNKFSEYKKQQEASVSPMLGALQKEEESLKQEKKDLEAGIKKERQKKRNKIQIDPMLLSRKKEIDLRLKSLRPELAAARALLSDDFKKTLKDEKSALLKSIRAEDPLLWFGTKGLQWDSIRKAKNEFGGPVQIFGDKIWTGTGRVGLQIHELTSEDFQSGQPHKELFLTYLPKSRQPTPGSRKARRGVRYASVTLQVGVEKARGNRVYATFPVEFHRPLPPGKIVFAWINVSKSGNRTIYEFQVSVKSDDFKNLTPRPANTNPRFVPSIPELDHKVDAPKTRRGVVALVLSQNYDKGVVPVAFAKDDQGKTFQISLDSTLFSRFNHIDDLCNIATKHFNAARHSFMNWMEKNGDLLSDDFRKNTSLDTIHVWKSSKKLSRVAWFLIQESFSDWEEIEHRDSKKRVTRSKGFRTYQRNGQIEKLWSDWKTYRSIFNRTRANHLQPKGDLFTNNFDKKGQVMLMLVDDRRVVDETLPVTFEEVRDWLMQKGVRKPLQHIAIYLEWWRRKVTHLYQCSRDLDRKTREWRNDFYKNVAAEIDRHYHTVLFVEENLAGRQKKKIEEPDAQFKDRRKFKARLAQGEFRQTFRTTLGRDYSRSVAVDRVQALEIRREPGESPEKLADKLLDCYFKPQPTEQLAAE